MSITLTPAEIAALTAERERLISSIAKRQESIDNQDDVVQAATDTDNAEKKAFDFYDIDVIRKYEDEREQLDGTYTENPVLKSELDAVGQLDANNRMFPAIGDTNPVRIAEFDGGGLVTTGNEVTTGIGVITPGLDTEPYWISRQAEVEDWLVNGLGGTSPTITPSVTVTDPINSSTTQINIDVTVPTETPAFAVGDRFIVDDGSQQVAVHVTGVTSSSTGTCAGETPPGSGIDEPTCLTNGGTWTPTSLGFVLDIVVLTSGSVSAGGTIDESWSGFSNADRAAKVDSTDGYTYLLNQMIDTLEIMVDNRLSKLSLQETALLANEDTSLDPQALVDVQDAISFLNSWKINKDVDDAELLTLSSERSSRTTEIGARIPAIGAAASAYYNDRYTSAVNIADTSRGTARIKFFRIDTQALTADLKQAEEDRKQAIEDLFDLAGVPYS